MDKVEKILSDRGSQYGKFSEVARTYGMLVETVREAGTNLDYEAECAIDMICMKLARIIEGNQYNRDSWIDIAGYAMLVVQRIDESKQIQEYNNKVNNLCKEYEESNEEGEDSVLYTSGIGYRE